MEHRVIVTADDFGACDYIDEGIREAIKTGVVSSVSAFVNFEPRDKDHPYGKYRGSIQAIKDLLSDIQDPNKFPNRPELRVGLHLNFHAGSPVSNPAEIKSLLLKEKEIIKKAKKSGKVKNKKKKVFRVLKPIEKFNPTTIKLKDFNKELYAQYNKFEKELGFDPDHLSSHFPIIFMTPKFFREVCNLAVDVRKGKLPVPIRNPFLIWQNSKKWASKEDKERLKQMRRFWKKRSKAKKINLKTAIVMADTVFDTLLNGWRKKNIKELVNKKIEFPDYTNCNLYGNGGENSDTVINMLNHLLDFRPANYKKDANKPLCTELIVHVGKGNLEAAKATAPSGINGDYFEGRGNELISVIKSQELINRTLFHYKSALQS